MVLSMTGFGESNQTAEDFTVSVQIRSVNNRYLKLSLRLADCYVSLESQVESEVRERVRRGAVQVNITTQRTVGAGDYRLRTDVLTAYLEQLQTVPSSAWGVRSRSATHEGHFHEGSRRGISSVVPDSIYAGVLRLPGVVEDASAGHIQPEHDWPFIQTVLREALDQFTAMRAKEGDAMCRDLRANGSQIASELAKIEARAPEVVSDYRERLDQRVRKVMEENGFELNSSDLIREIAVFTDRADISEETVRLHSHLSQFDAELTSSDCSGRKLEFMVQEMLRETNTIGSKANDGTITRSVIEIKTTLERIREMIQNIE